MNQEEIKIKSDKFIPGNYYVRALLSNDEELVGTIEEVDRGFVTFVPAQVSDKFPKGKAKYNVSFENIKSLEEFPSSEWN